MNKLLTSFTVPDTHTSNPVSGSLNPPFLEPLDGFNILVFCLLPSQHSEQNVCLWLTEKLSKFPLNLLQFLRHWTDFFSPLYLKKPELTRPWSVSVFNRRAHYSLPAPALFHRQFSQNTALWAPVPTHSTLVARIFFFPSPLDLSGTANVATSHHLAQESLTHLPKMDAFWKVPFYSTRGGYTWVQYIIFWTFNLE